jgi:squalene synthase HpnC
VSIDHYENFPVASVLMPAALRPAVMAIYRFARHADDIADEGNAAASERLVALAALDNSLAAFQSGARSQPPCNLQVTAVLPFLQHHRLDAQLLRDLLSAFSQDVVTTRYQSFEQVLDYCRRSANPVGRLLLQLYRVHDLPENQRQSDAICTALQLINFWQDVAIDLQKQRIYLPQDDLQRFAVSENNLIDRPGEVMQSPAWIELMRFEVDRATALMKSGAPLAWRLGGRIGLELRAVVHGGLRIAELLQKQQYDVVLRRPALRKPDWLVIAWRSLFVHPR